MKNNIKKTLKKILIHSPLLFELMIKLKNKYFGIERDYSWWVKNIEKNIWTSRIEKKGPLISIVVPLYNTPDKYLEPMIESVMKQKYKNWELCLSDASTDEDRILAISKISKSDPRIKLVHNRGFHISDNTNAGISISKGKYIAFLDHDDLLSPYALNEIVSVINNSNNRIDLIYSDEDKISDDGTVRSLPFFKPDWSPELLLGVNYITHFLVAKKSLINKTGKLRSKCDGAQDYDLLLRLTEKTDNIYHIPKILYHWRLADGSTSKNVGEKNYADQAGRLALGDAIGRRSIKADVIEIADRPTNYRLKYKIPKKQPFVSIIIPFKDKSDILSNCINSILDKTTYNSYEIILVSNNSKEKETFDLLNKFKKNPKIKLASWNFPFNYSKINNFAVDMASGEYIVLLNNDTEIITETWLEELLGAAMQPGIGCVGPMLLYPNSKDGIQHAGVIVGMCTMAGHVFRGRQPNDWTPFGMPVWPRNCLAVTGACLMVRKSIYEKFSGLDETFTIAGQDVAFCIKLYENGYRNIYWPFAQLIHHESVSVGSYHTGIKLDYEHSLKYYDKYIKSGDPYFNKNLDILNENISIGGIR